MATVDIGLIFGENGYATTFFFGMWWVVGLFLMLLFVFFLYRLNVNGKTIALVMLSGFAFIIIKNIFIDEGGLQVMMIPVTFIILFVSWYFYKWTQS